MTPAARIAAAIAAGELAVRDGERLAGFVALTGLVPGEDWERHTHWRRRRDLARLGVDVEALERADRERAWATRRRVA